MLPAISMIGLGRVGLPLSLVLAESGFLVLAALLLFFGLYGLYHDWRI